MGFSVATWNAEWATPGGRGPRISAVLNAADADVVVLTEGVRELLPERGFAVNAGVDWGYGPQPSRRKVIVWARFPTACEAVGEGGATRGRLVVTRVETPEGPLRVIGVCIPWRDAHVSTGRGDARPWSEHLDYLDRLEQLLAGLDDGTPTVIAGDYNQRVPRGRQPVAVADRLRKVFAGWTLHTDGSLPHGPHIDHIATDRRLVLDAVRDWPGSDAFGRLSDHAGVVCRFSFADPSVLVNPAETEPVHAPPITESQSSHALPQQVPHTDSAPRKDPTAMADTTPQSEGSLDPELRAEIEDILRRSGEGLSHGATFRLREQGLSDVEIAQVRGVDVATSRRFLRSLDALLSGFIPMKSLVVTNSYVYRELLNHSLSDKLAIYTRAQLRKLKEINPQVSFEPLNTRGHQYRVGTCKKPTPIGDVCLDCGLTHAGEC